MGLLVITGEDLVTDPQCCGVLPVLQAGVKATCAAIEKL